MMYNRGFAEDYDRWAAEGAYGWGFADVLPYFLRAESSWRGASSVHGASGPLTLAQHRPDPTLFSALVQTGKQHGLAEIADFDGTTEGGIGVSDFTINRGKRASTSTSYLRPAMRRKQLSVRTQALVHKLIIEGKRAVGVTYERAGELYSVYARAEVVLSAGTFNSPQILLLSGIGPAKQLQAHGLGVVHDLPGVGGNLQDHHFVGLQYELAPEHALERTLRVDRMMVAVTRWWLFGTGAAAGVPMVGQIFRRSENRIAWPNIQMVVSPGAMNSRLWFPGWRPGIGSVLSSSVVLLRPESRGAVTLRSPNPREAPVLKFGILQNPADLESLCRAVEFAQHFFATNPIAGFLRGSRVPAGLLGSKEAIDRFVRDNVATAMHPAGTCAMGVGSQAVLDHECRVRGVKGLRVVDASVMPHVVSGNTNAPTIMIAEKASDLILNRVTVPGRAQFISHPSRH
jgi:choline dehydrogenase